MSLEVTDNPQQRRYEIHEDGVLAGFAEYRERPDLLVFPHTVIDPAFEGRGLGSALIGGALDDVRAKGLGVRPLCSFVRAYIDRNPEYQDMLRD